MPLTEFQATLARLLSENRTFDSYLAGGAAILIEPNTTRYSRDLDYFHDSEARVAEAFAADRALLAAAGYAVEVELIQPGYVRAVVARGGDATRRATSSTRSTCTATCSDSVRCAGPPVGRTPGSLRCPSSSCCADAVGSVEPFASSRPADESGCLY